MAALAPLASASKPLTPPETDAHSAEPGRLGGFDGRLLAFAVALLCWQIALLSALLYEIISRRTTETKAARQRNPSSASPFTSTAPGAAGG